MNIALAVFIHEISFELLIPALPIDYYIVSFTDTVLLVTIFGIYVVLTSLLKLSRSWFKIKEIEREKSALELSNLRFQINPHFLLNTLNSIYALSLKQSRETPDAILKLSNMLKHILYGRADEMILLRKEIDYLQDYVELQKIRFAENADIQFNIEGDIVEQKIAPLLLITFFENSFKHGISGKARNGHAQFDLVVKENDLRFKAINNIGILNNTPEASGIGLDNVKKRLDLIYPNRHDLLITNDGEKFEVNLNIKL